MWQGFFYMHRHTDRIIHTIAFVTPVMEHWLEREMKKGQFGERSSETIINIWYYNTKPFSLRGSDENKN